tara:strand:- start:186 stop:299 length:114 start_codon:yes stop_codon:yes gene_type:complete
MFDFIGKLFFIVALFIAGDFIGLNGLQQLFVSMFGAG